MFSNRTLRIEFPGYYIKNVHFLFTLNTISFFLGWYEDNWFEINLAEEHISCTAEEMRIAAEGNKTYQNCKLNTNIFEPHIIIFQFIFDVFTVNNVLLVIA